MSQERKKVPKKPIIVVEARKRPEPLPEEPDKPLVKMSDDKYIKVADDAKIEEYRALNERILRGEIKWSHYAIDNTKSYHYYLIKK